MWARSVYSFADNTLSLSVFQDLDVFVTSLTCTPTPQWVVLYNTKLHVTLINPLQGSLYTGKFNVMRQVWGTKANHHRKLFPIKAR